MPLIDYPTREQLIGKLYIYIYDPKNVYYSYWSPYFNAQCNALFYRYAFVDGEKGLIKNRREFIG